MLSFMDAGDQTQVPMLKQLRTEPFLQPHGGYVFNKHYRVPDHVGYQEYHGELTSVFYEAAHSPVEETDI